MAQQMPTAQHVLEEPKEDLDLPIIMPPKLTAFITLALSWLCGFCFNSSCFGCDEFGWIDWWPAARCGPELGAAAPALRRQRRLPNDLLPICTLRDATQPTRCQRCSVAIGIDSSAARSASHHSFGLQMPTRFGIRSRWPDLRSPFAQKAAQDPLGEFREIAWADGSLLRSASRQSPTVSSALHAVPRCGQPVRRSSTTVCTFALDESTCDG